MKCRLDVIDGDFVYENLRLDSVNGVAPARGERASCTAEAMGRRKHLCLAGTLPAARQGLRGTNTSGKTKIRPRSDS